jgi:hypothetical protein
MSGGKSKRGEMVRKGGFEPPRLTAPPPQDGASASSATSARGEVKQKLDARQMISRWILNGLAYFEGEGAAGAGAAGAGADAGVVGAGTAGAGCFDVFENCCNTELPADARVVF